MWSEWGKCDVGHTSIRMADRVHEDTFSQRPNGSSNMTTLAGMVQ
jgi:hypothetical protein